LIGDRTSLGPCSCLKEPIPRSNRAPGAASITRTSSGRGHHVDERLGRLILSETPDDFVIRNVHRLLGGNDAPDEPLLFANDDIDALIERRTGAAWSGQRMNARGSCGMLPRG
jgi:hypothetical protein